MPRRGFTVVAIVWIAAGSLGSAQVKPLEFEAASIRTVDPKRRALDGSRSEEGGKSRHRQLPLKGLIVAAFRMSFWQISGGEAWMENENYNIEAVPPEIWQSRITNLRHTLFGIEDEHLREMLQSLLIERFQLQFHSRNEDRRCVCAEAIGQEARTAAF